MLTLALIVGSSFVLLASQNDQDGAAKRENVYASSMYGRKCMHAWGDGGEKKTTPCLIEAARVLPQHTHSHQENSEIPYSCA